MSGTVLITCRQMIDVFDHFADRFESAGLKVELAEFDGQQLSEAELLPIIDNFVGVVAGDDEFTRAVLEKGQTLRALSKWGVGTDGIDKKAALEYGITVTNTPGMFSNEVADVTIGYVISLARSLHVIDRQVRLGGWPKIRGMSLSGRTLGVLGLGGIGIATAKRAIAMEMKVVAYDPMAEAQAAVSAVGGRPGDLSDLWSKSDVIAINAPLNESTLGLFDDAVFEQCRKGLLLVNTGRGRIVKEAALVGALERGIVAGAALDVFEDEPIPEDSPLRQFDSVILGSHNASNTYDAVMRTSEAAVENLLRALETAK